MKFRTKYNNRTVRVGFDKVLCLTEQQYKKDCDINHILKSYGAIPPADKISLNMDVSDIGDFTACMERIQRGLDEFMELPSDIRMRFGNDPKAFYRWIVDPSNMDEAIKLGFLQRKVDEPTEKEILQDIAKTLHNEGVTQEGKENL